MKRNEMLSDRLNPPCVVGLKGLCCKNCLLGPCIGTRGVCGANRDVITARNVLRFVAGGTAAHIGHAYHLLRYLRKDYPRNYIKKKAPHYLFGLWNSLGIVPKPGLEHFKDVSEAMHVSTMGVNADYQDMLKWAMKLGIIDGYLGLYLATELEDRCYGRPRPRQGVVDLGVISKEKINIAVHGHEPMLAEAIAKLADKDINLIGVCCTGASLLARHGIPLAANFVLQEDVIATGAIEAMVVDAQCVMPSLADLSECYHTKLITTNELARIPHAIHLPVSDKKTASITARKIIDIAKQNRNKRGKISISESRKKVVVGFTQYNLPLKEIAKRLRKNEDKGIIAFIGCTNPRVKEDWIGLCKELSKDYIILTTGCMAFKLGQAGLLDGKRFFHLGSCVNNSRVAEVFRIIAEKCGKEITDMPFLVSCPMPITEKSIAIGFFFACLGVDVHFGYPFMLISNTNVEHFLKNLLKKSFKSKIFLETSPKALRKRVKRLDK